MLKKHSKYSYILSSHPLSWFFQQSFFFQCQYLNSAHGYSYVYSFFLDGKPPINRVSPVCYDYESLNKYELAFTIEHWNSKT